MTVNLVDGRYVERTTFLVCSVNCDQIGLPSTRPRLTVSKGGKASTAAAYNTYLRSIFDATRVVCTYDRAYDRANACIYLQYRKAYRFRQLVGRPARRGGAVNRGDANRRFGEDTFLTVNLVDG